MAPSARWSVRGDEHVRGSGAGGGCRLRGRLPCLDAGRRITPEGGIGARDGRERWARLHADGIEAAGAAGLDWANRRRNAFASSRTETSPPRCIGRCVWVYLWGGKPVQGTSIPGSRSAHLRVAARSSNRLVEPAWPAAPPTRSRPRTEPRSPAHEPLSRAQACRWCHWAPSTGQAGLILRHRWRQRHVRRATSPHSTSRWRQRHVPLGQLRSRPSRSLMTPSGRLRPAILPR